MTRTRKISFAFSFLVSILISVHCVGQVNPQDSLALVDFYDSTDGANWNYVTWDLSKPVTQWDGVGVSSGRVTSLTLTGAFSKGKMPASFGNLSELKTISLLDCRFTEATLPETFSNLTNLTSIKMSAVFWYLPFPASITQLTNLKSLDLQDNFFTDGLPASIGNLTQLEQLDLSNCFSVNGTNLPTELGNLNHLISLNLNHNKLNGSIPESFANLDSLNSLDVSFNDLQGTIPEGLNHLKNLNYFLANDNHYTFRALEPFIQSAGDNGKTYADLFLNPQKLLPVQRKGQTLFISPGGTPSNNTFNWYKVNQGLVATNTADSTFTPVDKGDYFATVANSVVTELTLNSDTFHFDFFVADSDVSIVQNITGTDTTYINDGFFRLAALKPVDGTNALSGEVSISVTVDDVVKTSNGQPYVQRHYDITPETNAENAQAIVVLYFSQQDFDNYNDYVSSNHLSYPLMPTNGVDNGNIRITQFHGTFNATPEPENYDPSNVVVIKPNVRWNAIHQWWEVTFYANGFSGFFVSTSTTALPLILTEFVGRPLNNGIELNWSTARELNIRSFVIEHSLDGTAFSRVGVVNPISGSGKNQYSFFHSAATDGNQFYRLKIVDIDGSISYSQTIKIYFKDNGSSLTVFPNPITSTLNVRIISIRSETSLLQINNVNGGLVYQQELLLTKGAYTYPLNLHKLPVGVYHLSIVINGSRKMVSFKKQTGQ